MNHVYTLYILRNAKRAFLVTASNIKATPIRTYRLVKSIYETFAVFINKIEED